MSIGAIIHPLGTMLHRGLLTTVRQQVSTLLIDDGTDSVEIALRRGNATVAVQTVRLVNPLRGSETESRTAGESKASLIVQGSADMDVAVGDRFTHEGSLFEIVFIRPNRQHETLADARVAQ